MIDIAIWGAGKFGEFILKQINQNPEYNVKFIIDGNNDTDYLNERAKILGKTIISADDFYNYRQSDVEFVLVTFLGGVELLLNLDNRATVKFGCVKNCVFLRGLTLEIDLRNDTYIIWDTDINVIKNKAYMNHLQCNIIDSCNLNCKGCSHFANLFDSNSIYDFSLFLKDIERISSIIYLEEIVLVGGEPFLNDRIIDYIEAIKEKMPKTTVMIVTNGILIPKLEQEIVEGLYKNKVRIIITEYPPTSKIKDKIVSVLEENKISFIFTQKVSDFGKNLDLEGNNDPYYAQRHCRQYICQFLRQGKIYKCPFSALNNHFFDYFGLPEKEDTGIDIYSDIEWGSALKKLYDEPIEICKYCGEEERFQWQSNKHVCKEDWVI